MRIFTNFLRFVCLTPVLFLAFVFQVAAVFGQSNFKIAQHYQSEMAAASPVGVGTDVYFVTWQIGAPAYGQSALYKYNGAGNPVYRKLIALPSDAKLLFKTLGNSLLVAGGDWQCDVMMQDQVNYLAKFDTSGNAVFQATYTVKISDSPVACVQRSDSGYYSFTDSLVICHDKNGLLMFRNNLGISGIKSALILPGGNVLLSAGSATAPILYTMLPGGTITSSVSAPAVFKKLSFYGLPVGGVQKIMALGTNGQFYRLSPGYVAIGQSNFSGGQYAHDFVWARDTLYTLMGAQVAGTNEYRVIDTAFTTHYASVNTTARHTFKGLCLTPGGDVVLLGDGVAHVTPNFTVNDLSYYTSLTRIGRFSSAQFTDDVELRSVTVDSMYNSFTPNLSFPQFSQATVYLRAKVKVKNKGTKVITSVKVNCYESQDVACGHYYFQQQFSGLNLAAGDSMVLTTTSFVTRRVVPASISQTVSQTYCFFTSQPNGEPDRVLSDNELCRSFSHVITSLPSLGSNYNGLKLYPNPVNECLFIETQAPVWSARLVNSLGQEVAVAEQQSGTGRLETNALPPGVYFVTFQCDSGVLTYKVIKQ